MNSRHSKLFHPMKKIGIIGGSSDVSTAEYYRSINNKINQKLGGHNIGEIIINSMNFEKSNYFLNNNLFTEGGKYIQEKAFGLERAGADFIVLACNTWHCAADIFMEGLSIPLLHIADPTAKAISSQNITKVGLLGTKATMDGQFLSSRFKDIYDITTIIPLDREKEIINNIIFDELTRGIFSKAAKEEYLKIIDSLSERGAEGIILGCTEIPMLIKQLDRPSIPMFDTTDLHISAAVMLALDE